MRIMFLFFAVFGFLFRLSAQDSTTVRVFSRYNLLCNTTNQPEPFFTGRSVSPLSDSDMEKLLLFSTNAIRSKAGNGNFVIADYDIWNGVRSGFPDMYIIDDIEHLAPEDFQLNPLHLYNDYQRGNFQKCKSFEKQKDGSLVGGKCIIDSAGRIISRKDMILVQADTSGNLSEKIDYTYLKPKDASVFFAEEWSFDRNTGKFIKNIRFSGFGQLRCDDRKPYCFIEPLYTVQWLKDSITPTWSLFKKNQITDVAVNHANASIEHRLSKEKIDENDFYYFQSDADGTIAPDYRMPFLAALISYAMKNPERVCPLTDDGVIDLKHPFKTNLPVKDAFTMWDSAQVENPYNPGEYYIAPIKMALSLNDIYAIRFYEDWYINEKTGFIRKDVYGISFLFNRRDAKGNPVFLNAGIYISTR